MKYQLNAYYFTAEMTYFREMLGGQLIALLPFFLAQESWSVESIRLSLPHA